MKCNDSWFTNQFLVVESAKDLEDMQYFVNLFVNCGGHIP